MRLWTVSPDLRVSRIPIFEGELDAASGFVMKTDLLLARSRGDDEKPISEYRRDILTLAADSSAKVAFDRLLGDRQHIALVIDQYGSAVGIITLEDVIETLLGLEIVDEQDSDVDLQQVARDQWKARAEKIGLELPDGGSVDGTQKSP